MSRFAERVAEVSDIRVTATPAPRQIARTRTLDFLPGTEHVRSGDWSVAPAPADLRDHASGLNARRWDYLFSIIKNFRDAFIPSRRDQEVNERAFARVREDQLREAGASFDGSWVAHPDLVTVCADVCGNGVAGINNLMEDAATAETSRSQIWQWAHNGDDASAADHWDRARELFVQTAVDDQFVDFLTLPAYDAVLAQEKE